MQIEQLRRAILAKHKSIHAFCASVALPRSLVYQVLAGSYAGASDKQIMRIYAALEGSSLTERIFAKIKETGCAKCVRGKKCSRCDALFMEYAVAIREVI